MNSDIRTKTGIQEYIDEATFGDARNDSINRFYLAGVGAISSMVLYLDHGIETGKCIYEVWRDISTGKWEKNIIDYDSVNFSGDISNIVIADGRNDGVNRLYVLRSYLPTLTGEGSILTDPVILEYTWTGSSWTKTVIDTLEWTAGWSSRYFALSSESSQTSGASAIESTPLAVGKIKGDGINRFYVNLLADDIYEYTWTGSSWTKAVIYVDTSLTQGIILISDARNDGKERLYIGYSGGGLGYYSNILEYEWLNNSWNYTQMAGFKNATSMVIGEGRNDRINRIYGKHSNKWPYLYEATWENNQWVVREYDLRIGREDIMSSVPGDLIVATIGDGHNDGIERIYLVPWFEDTKICELTWNGNGWNRVDYELGEGDFYRSAALFMIAKTSGSPVMNKAYTGALREYVFAYPQDPYDKSKTAQDKLQPVNNYFKRGGGWASVWYYVDEPGNVSLKVYNIKGELVKILFDGWKDKGEYCEVWTGRNEAEDICGTGLYLINLVTPRGNITKKICIAK